MSRKKNKFKPVSGIKLSKQIYRKRRDNEIDQQARIKAAEGIRDFAKHERIRIESICPWYLIPFLLIARRYIYGYLFGELENILVKDWLTSKIKRKYKRFIPDAEVRFRQLQEAQKRNENNDKQA